MRNKGPKLNRDWVGLRVKNHETIRNGCAKVEKGSTGTIIRYPSTGIIVEFDSCKTCKVAPIFSRMHRMDFLILTPMAEWPDTRGKGRRST